MADKRYTTVQAADLYGDVPALVELPPWVRWRDLLPGLIVAGLGALAAGFFSDRYGAPPTMMALLLGLALNFLSADRRLASGLGFASHTLLRCGIVLVGARVTAGQVASLGLPALACIVAIVALTIGSGIVVARRLGFDTAFGVLAGGAVAICGASAAMALAATLGPRRVAEERLILVLVSIAAASASAMLLYPVAAHLLRLSDLQAGFLLGASIHDVAQALGAGYSYSDGAGQIAAIVKLSRVALLAPVLLVVSFFVSREGGRRAGPLVPWFVLGFFGLAALNSIGLVPQAAAHVATISAEVLLTLAVTATGIRSPLPALLRLGPRPLVVTGVASLVAFLLSLTAAWFVVAR